MTTVQTDSSAHSSATLAACGVAPLVSQTLGLVDGRAPDVMPAIRARSADGWPTLRGDEAGFADGAPVAPPALQPLAELHTAGACHKVSLWGSRVTSDHIVMPSESALVPVPSAAPRARRLSGREWRPRATVPTESIGEHRGAVMAIGADIADAISAVSDPYPV